MRNGSMKGIHVAIIMDGNGRWAARKGLPRAAGHRAGLAAALRVVEHAPDAGVGELTLYAFSSDNWRRPAIEVENIFWLLRAFLRLETHRLSARGARLQVIGRRDRLPEPVLRAIEKAEVATAAGSRLHLRVAIDYSSRYAIAMAAYVVAKQTCDDGLTPNQIYSRLACAFAGEIGDADLLIRTGGEKRLSDFLLWESAYAELYFTDSMWPDFGAAELDAAIASFHRRERRFGGLPAAVVSMRGGAR
jgi:undecaprenyl diphosphate synthase